MNKIEISDIITELMISTGVDIIEVKRIKNVIRSNKKFLQKVYTPVEVEYCLARKNKWQHFAVRFAAKEAVWKALGRKDIWHRDITVKNGPSGEPCVILSGRHKKVQGRVSLSLSHTEDYAVAVAVYDKR